MKQGNLSNIYFWSYTAISRFELDKFKNYRNTINFLHRVFAIFDSSWLQNMSDKNIISLNKSPDILWQRTFVVSSPRMFPMQCINPILDPKMVIPTLFLQFPVPRWPIYTINTQIESTEVWLFVYVYCLLIISQCASRFSCAHDLHISAYICAWPPLDQRLRLGCVGWHSDHWQGQHGPP